MQRIFNYDKIQYITFTPDNVVNILLYGSPFCVITFTTFYYGPVFLAHSVVI